MSSIQSMNAKFHVEKFDGKNNFGLWQVKVRDLLIQQGLHRAILGREKRPASMTDEIWEDMDLRAVSSIRLSLADEVIYNVLSESTAAGLWLKLESLYMTKSLTNRLFLKQQLYKFSMRDGISIHDHLNAFNELISKLMAIDVLIEEEDRALILLSSLPASYEHLVTTLLYGKDTIAFDDVVASLLSHEMRRKASVSVDVGSASGLYVRGRSSDRAEDRRLTTRSKSKGKSKKFCNYCKKPGHFISECYKLKNRTEDSSMSASVAEEDSVSEIGTLLSASETSTSGRDQWVLDSGCSFHMSPHRGAFYTYSSCSGGCIFMGNNTVCAVVGIGSIRIRLSDGSIRTFEDVRHVPDIQKNLLSVSQLDSAGYKIIVEAGFVKIVKGSLVVLKGKKNGTLYSLLGSTVFGDDGATSKARSDIDSLHLWHMRLGHMSVQNLHVLRKRKLIDGVDERCKLHFCDACVIGKHQHVSFAKVSHYSKGKHGYIHSGVWGPSSVQSLGGAHYFVSFVDDFSRKVWVYPIKEKSQVLGVFKRWSRLYVKQSGKKIKCLRSDSCGEYVSSEFRKFCQGEGIAQHYSSPRHRCHDVATKVNRVLVEDARCLLISADLPMHFWGEALSTSAYLANRSPNAFARKSPEEVWSRRCPSIAHIRVFGCIAYARVRDDDKLEPRVDRCIFLGYGHGVGEFRLWCTSTRRLIISSHVEFDESNVLDRRFRGSTVDHAPGSFIELSAEMELSEPRPISVGVAIGDDTEVQVEQLHSGSCQDHSQPTSSIAHDRPFRESSTSVDFGISDTAAFALISEYGLPTSRSVATTHPLQTEWSQPTLEVVEPSLQSESSDLVPLTRVSRGFGCRMMFLRKRGIPVSFTGGECYRAPLLPERYASIGGMDPNLLLPDMHTSSFRILLSLCALYMLEPVQLSVFAVLSVRELEREIYLQHFYRFSRYPSLGIAVLFRQVEQFSFAIQMIDFGPLWSYVIVIVRVHQRSFVSSLMLSSSQSPSTVHEIRHLDPTSDAYALGVSSSASVSCSSTVAIAVRVSAVLWLLQLVLLLCTSSLSFYARGYTDSDLVGFGYFGVRRSDTGFALHFVVGLILWISSYQDTVALSTSVMEFLTAADATMEFIWLIYLLCRLGSEPPRIIIFFTDRDSSGIVTLSVLAVSYTPELVDMESILFDMLFRSCLNNFHPVVD